MNNNNNFNYNSKPKNFNQIKEETENKLKDFIQQEPQQPQQEQPQQEQSQQQQPQQPQQQQEDKYEAIKQVMVDNSDKMRESFINVVSSPFTMKDGIIKTFLYMDEKYKNAIFNTAIILNVIFTSLSMIKKVNVETIVSLLILIIARILISLLEDIVKESNNNDN